MDKLNGAIQGTNDFDVLGYRGPCPPEGDGKHTYTFTVLLLDTTLDLDPGTDSETFRETLDPQTLDGATITGTYER